MGRFGRQKLIRWICHCSNEHRLKRSVVCNTCSQDPPHIIPLTCCLSAHNLISCQILPLSNIRPFANKTATWADTSKLQRGRCVIQPSAAAAPRMEMPTFASQRGISLLMWGRSTDPILCSSKHFRRLIKDLAAWMTVSILERISILKENPVYKFVRKFLNSYLAQSDSRCSAVFSNEVSI